MDETFGQKVFTNTYKKNNKKAHVKTMISSLRSESKKKTITLTFQILSDYFQQKLDEKKRKLLKLF